MARANLKISVGSYAGNSVSDRLITGVGFQPDVILFYPSSTADACFFTKEIPKGSLARQPAAADAVARVDVTEDGFSVSSAAFVNSTGVNYHYVAFQGTSSSLFTLKYVGNLTDDRNFTDIQKIPFTPSAVFVKNSAASNALYWRTSANVGDDTCIGSSANGANAIQSLIANGFQLGATAGTNGSGVTYYAFGFPELPSTFFSTGTYVGNGTAQSITGLSFQPDYVMVKNATSAVYAVACTSTMGVDMSRPINGVVIGPGYITSLDSQGFTVGSNSRVNENGSTHYWYAFKAGNWIVPVNRNAR